MFDWFRRRRLSASVRKKLMILSARAEEAIIRTHVANILELIEALGDEVSLDRALELYAEMMSLEEGMANTVANRVLAHLENPAPASRFRDVFHQGR